MQEQTDLDEFQTPNQRIKPKATAKNKKRKTNNEAEVDADKSGY